ncbi:hypothetical protein [Paenarthrobacter aromaticivorans]|uniref:hypothetical protein n=1 Tax=Paenarthrobacter aromaticivorans TaxID=2849150 RepID=UPI003A7FE1E3
MTALLFPDNTVLCNYACVDRIDLLKAVVSDRGRWTQAVYAEARQSSKVWPSLGSLMDYSLLGEPIEIEDAEQVNRIRQARLSGSPLKPTQHLGEAETCYLIHTDASYRDSIWITDDYDAFDFAKQLQIVTWDTRTTLETLVSMGETTAEQAFELLQEMHGLGRNPRRMPAHYRELQ